MQHFQINSKNDLQHGRQPVTASWKVGNETGMVGNDGFMVARCHFHFLAEFSLLNPQAHL
jgi:hypothetical protein